MAVINGTSGADTLADTSADDTINGLAGNDTINGGTGGHDVVNGGDGRDSFVFRTARSDVFVDFVAGTVTGGGFGMTRFTGIEKVVTGDFNDQLIGDALAQNLTAQAGMDTLAGGGGNDTLWGGSGADTFIFREIGTANADTFGDWTSGQDTLLLDGTVMTALGANGDFTASDARFWASSTGTAHDADDRIIYNSTTRQIFYDADGNGSGAAQLIATLQSGATLVATDISIVNSPVSGGQVINGTAGNDSLTGTQGDDTLNGFGGDDTIDGGDGFDSMDGGLGNDSYHSNQLAAGSNPGDVIVDAGGTDTLTLTGINVTLQDGIENLILRPTGFGGGLATGNSLNNLIRVDSSSSAYVETLDGAAGDDTLIGGPGDETFMLSSGNDFIDGGSDQLSMLQATSAVVADFGAGTATSAVGTTTFVNVGGIFGSAFNDKLMADDWRLLDGGGGDDTVTGGSDGGSLHGGDGNDLVTGGAGADFIGGGGGNDTLDGGFGNDTFTIQGAAGSDTINGGEGHDDVAMFGASSGASVDLGAGTLTGGGTTGSTLISIESFVGGAFDDLIVGSNAANNLQGEGGSDTIDGGAGNDTLAGGRDFSSSDVSADTFRFSVAPGAANADLIGDFVSGRDEIVLDGSVHANTGPSGSFTFGDARFVANGTGTAQDASDRVVYNTSNGQLWYDADGTGSGAAQLIATVHMAGGSPATLAANDISIINGSVPAGQVINGTAGNDSLAGGQGDDTLNGFGGDDTIDGGEGFDSMDGGLGNDTYYSNQLAVASTPGDVIVDAGGTDTLTLTGIDVTLPGEIENLILRPTGFGGGLATGNSLNNLIRVDSSSGAYVETLDGAAGDDTLIGGPGDETFMLSSGNDSIDGGGSLNTIVATSAVAVDFRTGTATSAVGTTSFVNVEAAHGSDLNDRLIADDVWRVLDGRGGDDTLTGGSNGGSLHGGAGNDLLTGGAAHDFFTGGAGNDTLDGLAGDDTFHVQGTAAGSDTINGGEGHDDVLLFAATSGASVNLGAGTLTGGGTTGSTLISIESFVGGDFDDLIVGSSAANNLGGDDGRDTIDGGAGNDTLTGGHGGFSPAELGVDTFRFSVAPGAANADVIRDFVSGQDQILLDGTVHVNSGPSGSFTAGDTRFVANGTGTAQDASDRVVYNTSNGQLWYDADGTGSGAAQLIATVHIVGGSPANLRATDISITNAGGSAGQVINGTSGADTLADTPGNDTINGLAGNDTIHGGSGGTDVINGGDGRDSLSLAMATGPVVVDFGAGTAGTTSFTNIEKVVTGDFNDTLTGNAAAQNLTAQRGADTLAGAGGVDTLWGGAGNDTFIFRETGTANADTIGDWTSGSDDFALDNSVLTGLGADGAFVAGDARFWASSTGAANDANDRVIYNTTTRGLYYDADGTGSGAAQLIATVQAGTAISATDIVVI